ncbi:MAG TPA: hypothetical protein EYP14_17200, partial [Planctomycetaceae bacterium]|nr:hypothetical protein [Planctomycetaceae bacterium]
KAAAELRERFQTSLEEAARKERQRAKAARLANALADIDQLTAGTIHSFCARLLRERPIEAGVNPNFTEIDDVQDGELRRQAWHECIESLQAAGSPLLGQLHELGLTPQQLEGPFIRFADYPDVDCWPAPDFSDAPALPQVRAALRQFIQTIQQWPAELLEDPGTDKLLQPAAQLLRRYRAADLADPCDLHELLELVQRKKLENNDLRVKRWKAAGASSEAALAAWNDFKTAVAEPALKAWWARRYKLVVALFQEVQGHYDRLREQLGVMNFQDLLMRAALLLREHPHVRRYFSRRYTHLLVDEFQDTDPIQAEVMLLLTATELNERDWTRCRPRPGSLFVVGDPKQSIYRFRRADIVTYNRVREIIERYGQVVQLSANFRSTAEMRDWVNSHFERCFP